MSPAVRYSSERDEYQCPTCEEWKSSAGIGQHWGHPQGTCTYPCPTPYQQGLLAGLVLSGASVEQRGTNPVVRKSTVNKAALKWLCDQLGVWGSSVDEGASAAKQTAVMRDVFGYDGESQTQWRLTTRSCPFLHELTDCPTADLPFSASAARVLFSFSGRVIDRSAVSIRHPDGRELATLLREAGFENVSLYDPPEGKSSYRLVLSSGDSREFLSWIGRPIPGYEHKAVAMRELREELGPKSTRRLVWDTLEHAGDARTVFVSPANRAGRKRHLLVERDHGYFEPQCNIASETSAFEIVAEEMRTSEYLGSSDRCKRCAATLDATTTTVDGVDFDPVAAGLLPTGENMPAPAERTATSEAQPTTPPTVSLKPDLDALAERLIAQRTRYLRRGEPEHAARCEVFAEKARADTLTKQDVYGPVLALL
jgi:hypothetical protein